MSKRYMSIFPPPTIMFPKNSRSPPKILRMMIIIMHLDILPPNPHNIRILMPLNRLNHPSTNTPQTPRYIRHDSRPQVPCFLPSVWIAGEVDCRPCYRSAFSETLRVGCEIGHHGVADDEGFGFCCLTFGADGCDEFADFLPLLRGEECVVVME